MKTKKIVHNSYHHRRVAKSINSSHGCVKSTADKFNIRAIAQNVKVTNNMSRRFEVISHVPQEALINFTELSV